MLYRWATNILLSLFVIFSAARQRSVDVATIRRNLGDGDTSQSGMQRDNSSDADSAYRQSGTGILQFSAEKAGLDVTPAHFYTGTVEHERCYTSAFSSVAGQLQQRNLDTLAHLLYM